VLKFGLQEPDFLADEGTSQKNAVAMQGVQKDFEFSATLHISA
jgi:hypothetical protein